MANLALCSANAATKPHMRRESVMTHGGQVLAHAPKKSHDAPAQKVHHAHKHKVANVKAETAKVATAVKKTKPLAKSAPKVALSAVKTRKRRQVRRVSKKSARKAHTTKKAVSALKHSKAKLQAHQQRRVASMMEKMKPAQDPNATADAAPAAPAGPANPVPDDGFSKDLASAEEFGKAFEISFKVKFNNFLRNEQALVTTNEHSLFIQALGPKYQGDAGKISAWMKVDSGLGPHNRGVVGSDGSGQLLSQKLTADAWHDVKFKKDATTLNLIVDGIPCHLCPIAIDRTTIIHLPEFDMERGSKQLLAGAKAGHGDVGLDGNLADITFVEGPGADAAPLETATTDTAAATA